MASVATDEQPPTSVAPPIDRQLPGWRKNATRSRELVRGSGVAKALLLRGCPCFLPVQGPAMLIAGPMRSGPHSGAVRDRVGARHRSLLARGQSWKRDGRKKRETDGRNDKSEHVSPFSKVRLQQARTTP
jgi:hypothetical protein